MRLDIFKKCVDKIPFDVGIWFGGMAEPWLNQDCTEMLLYAHKKGHRISVFTTLVGMNLSDIDLLEPIPFNFFRIHIPSKEGFERINVDGEYLRLLSKISRSNINVKYHYHGETVNSNMQSLMESSGIIIQRETLKRRAGNLKLPDSTDLPRRRGVIGCLRGLKNNVLLPNGDVILCSNDYGMKHVLGNIISSDYSSLFSGKEFAKIKTSLRDESLNTICRYCDNLCYDASLSAFIYNFPYTLDYLRDIRNLSELYQFVKKVISKFKENLYPRAGGS
jgi:radical SAM protein with 4Fe4S-binding SPASM domain